MKREDRAVLIFESLLLVCAVLAGTLDWQTRIQPTSIRALILAQITVGLIGLTAVASKGSPMVIAGLLIFAHLIYALRTEPIRGTVFFYVSKSGLRYA